METSLLKTKLGIPPLRGPLVSRDRLLDTLRQCLDYNLTLVSAPAGFGKTTLLSQCAHQDHADFSIAWFSIDKSDDDPVRYWRYVIGALKTSIRIDTEEAELLLRTPGTTTEPNMESFVTLLLNSLASVEMNFVIILDDYHLIESPAIYQSMIYLLEHLPPVMHVIIATREDPPFPLARFRGKGMLLTISSDKLRFDLHDASRLLQEYQAPALTDKDVAALNERTEGWAVGLKMAALSLKDQQDVAGFIQLFMGSQSYIMDYLFEEVLQQQPPEVRDFLLKTSILVRLNGSLCNALTGRKNGQETLVNLEKANLFVAPLDESREWYRYEHLFANLLQHRLVTELGVDQCNELHSLASRWFESKGLLDAAVEHSLEAQDWDNVIGLIEAKDLLIVYGSMIYIWLQRVPPDVLRVHPIAYASYLYSMISTGYLERVKDLLDKFEASAEYDESAAVTVRGARIAIASNQGDPRIEEYAKEHLALLPPDAQPKRMSTIHYLGNYLIGARRYNEADQLLKQVYEFAQAENASKLFVNRVTALLAIIAIYRGGLHEAEYRLKQALGITHWGINTAAEHMLLSVVYHYLNDLENEAIERNEALSSFPELKVNSALYLNDSALRLAHGYIGVPIETLEHATGILVSGNTSPEDIARNAAYHLGAAVDMNDRYAISFWLDKLSEYEGPFLHDIPAIARHLLFQRVGNAGRKRLQEEYERLHKEGYRFLEMGVRLEQALLTTTSTEAVSYLADVLAMAKPEGNIRILADLGQLVVPLLREVIAAGIETEFASKILKIIEDEAYQRKMQRGAIPPASSLLSEREMEVLQLLETGLSNQQIAESLMISLSTTKTHIHHVLEKLDAKDRTHAIYRAKELNILTS